MKTKMLVVSHIQISHPKNKTRVQDWRKGPGLWKHGKKFLILRDVPFEERAMLSQLGFERKLKSSKYGILMVVNDRYPVKLLSVCSSGEVEFEILEDVGMVSVRLP